MDQGFGAKLLKRKGLLIGGGAAVVVAGLGIAFFLFLLGFKLNHIRNLFIDYQFYRFNRTVSERAAKMITEEAALEGSGSLPQEGALGGRSLLDKLAKFDPDAALTKLGNEGKIKFVFEEEKSWLFRKKNSYKGFIDENGEFISKNSNEHVGRLRSAIDENFAIESKFFRSRLDAQIRAVAGIKRTAWKDDGAESRGKTAQEAAEIERRATVEEVLPENQKPPSSFDEVNNGVEEVRQGIKAGKTAEQIEASLARQSLMGKIKSFSAIVGTVTLVCIIDDLFVHNLNKAIDLRSDAAMRLAHRVFTEADQQKAGHTSAEAVNAAVQKFDGFEQSAAYARATGQPVDPKTDLTEDSRPQQVFGGAPQKAVGVIGVFDKIANPFCKVLLDPRAVVATLAIEVAVAAGTAGAGETAAQAIVRTFGAALPKMLVFTGGVISADILIGKAIKSYAGLDTTGNEEPVQYANRVDMGTDLLANEFARQSGGHELAPAQVKQYSLLWAQDQSEKEAKSGIADRLFNLSNPRSLATRALVAIPTSSRTLIAKINTFLARTFNPSLWVVGGSGQVSLTWPSGNAWAADDGEDPYGITQFGFALDEINRFGVRENAQWVETQLDSLENDYGKCFDGSVTIGDYIKDPGPCNDTSERAMRYRQYVFDTHIADNIVSLGNEEDDSGTSAPVLAGGVVPSGSAQDLARQILARPTRITFTTALAKQNIIDTANGKPVYVEGRCLAEAKANRTPSEYAVIAGPHTLDPGLLAALLASSDNYRIGIGYLVNGCHLRSERIPSHYVGKGADINSVNGQASNGNTRPDWDFLNLLGQYLPSGSRLASSSCFSGQVSDQGGKISFFSENACTHLHVDTGPYQP